MAHSSLWQTALRHEDFPVLAGEVNVDVAVVGAGLAGVMNAYLLKQSGLRVALVEARTVGCGETRNTTAHLTALTDEPFYVLIDKHGLEKTRLAWDAGMEAIELIEAISSAHDIDCDFQRVAANKFAADEEQRYALEAEADALLALGIGFETGRLVPLPCVDALRFDEQAQFHPLAFLHHLVTLIPGDGSHVFEHSRVEKMSGRKLQTAQGTVRAEGIVYATHYPIQEARMGLKLQPYMSYAIAIQGKHHLDNELYYDYQDPYHYIRRQRDLVIVGGEDHHTGEQLDPRKHHERLVDYARRNISPNAEVRYAWSGQVLEPLDGLPYIGKRNRREWVASGFSGAGMTFGALSGRINTDLILKRDNPYAELLSPRRLKGIQGFAEHGAHVAKEYTARASELQDLEVLSQLAAGDGVLIRRQGKILAVSRDEEGELHAVSAVCTHMGCMVRWNGNERTWDCPCHGSRFTGEGQVYTGPAVKALRPMSLEDEGWARGLRDMGRSVRDAVEPPPGP